MDEVGASRLGGQLPWGRGSVGCDKHITWLFGSLNLCIERITPRSAKIVKKHTVATSAALLANKDNIKNMRIAVIRTFEKINHICSVEELPKSVNRSGSY